MEKRNAWDNLKQKLQGDGIRAEEIKQRPDYPTIQSEIRNTSRGSTPGRYYKKPELNQDRGKLESEVDRSKAKVKWAQKRANEEQRKYEKERRFSLLKEALYKNGQLDKRDYIISYAQSSLAENKARAAAEELQKVQMETKEKERKYSQYIMEQDREFQKWKSTIRSPETVAQEMRTADGELGALEQRRQSLKNMNLNLARYSGYTGTVSAMHTRQNDQMIQKNMKELGEINQKIEQMKKSRELLEEEHQWGEYYQYEDLRENPDFAARSQYQTTKNGRGVIPNYGGDGLIESGFDDLTYDLINKNPEAQIRQAQMGAGAGDLGHLGMMNEDEVAMFNYLYATQGKDAAYGYVSKIEKELTKRQRESEKAYFAGAAQAHPVASSALSVMLSPVKGVTRLGQVAEKAITGEIDQNAAYNRASYIGNDIRQAVAQKIQDSGKWGKIGSYGYMLGMSMADFVTNAAVGGGIARGMGVGQALSSNLTLGIMGSGAAADATIEAKDRGLSDNQAFTLGTIAGLAEIVTEKVSLDSLLDADLAKDSLVKFILKNMGAEGSEEVASDAINLLADVMISKDKSEWQQSVKVYRQQGMSEQDAMGHAVKDQALKMGADFLGGAISGGLLSTAQGVRYKVSNRSSATQESKKKKPLGEWLKNPKQQLDQAAQDRVNPAKTGEMPTAEAEDTARKVNNAKTIAEKSGYTWNVDEETIQSAARMTNLIGKEIMFYREGETAGGIKNGYYDPDSDMIYINAESENPLAQIVGHELTHSLEGTQEYEELKEQVLTQIDKTKDDLEAERNRIRELYHANKIELDQAGIDEEIVAQYMEQKLLTDESAITELAAARPTVAKKIRMWLDKILAKMGNRSAKERVFLENARNLYRKAMAAAADPAQRNAAAYTMEQAWKNGDDAQGDAAFEGVYGSPGYVDQILDEAPDKIRYRDETKATRYSISENTDGEKVAVVDDDILSGIDLRQWNAETAKKVAKAAASALKEKEGVVYRDGDAVLIDRTTRREYTRSNSTQMLKKKQPAVYMDKMRAAEVAGDILVAAIHQPGSKGLSHARKDDFVRFEYGKVLIQAGTNQYEAKTVIGIKRGGERVFYDIVTIHPTKFQIKKESPPAATSGNQAVSVIVGDSFDNSISGKSGNVKKKNTNGRKYSVTEQTTGSRPDIETEPNQDETVSEMDKLPSKAADAVRKAQRYFVQEVGKELSLTSRARQEIVMPVANQVVETFLKDGKLDQDAMEELFDRAYEAGRVVNSEMYDTYKDVVDYLRTTKVTISQKDKVNIEDYGDFHKRSFGKLRIVKEGGLPVDTAWQELQEMAPALFPEGIVTPSDQLEHMLGIADTLKKTEQTLDQYYGKEAPMYRKFARTNFDAAITELTTKLKQAARYRDDRARIQQERQEAMEADERDLTLEDAQKLYQTMKEKRRDLEKAVAKTMLTEEDKQAVEAMLRGQMSEDDAEQMENGGQILMVYRAKMEFEKAAQPIRAWKKKCKEKVLALAEQMTVDANRWKDKKMGIGYQVNTMERNLRDIIPSKAEADRVIDTYFKPIHQNEADATKLKNRLRKKVEELNLSTKVVSGNQVSESYAVQFLGEAMDAIQMIQDSNGRIKTRDGKTAQEWQGEVQKMWEESPDLDRDKIKNAVEVFRGIYNELFTQMNEVRVRNGYEPIAYRKGYFPHFVEEESSGVMSLLRKMVGGEQEVSSLPTTINGLTQTFRPGIRWFGNAMQRDGFQTVYDAVKGFDRYVNGAADMIYHTDDIQKLRALAQQVRYRTSDKGLRDQIDQVRADETISNTERELRIKDILEHGRYKLANFVAELDEYTNLLANKRSKYDREMEGVIGREAYNLSKAMEGRVAANMVALNPGSWLTNFIPLTQGWSAVSTKNLLQGMKESMMACWVDDGMVDSSAFLTNRRGSDPLVKGRTQSVSQVLAKPMEWIDNFTAGALVRARYHQNLQSGLSEMESIQEADQWTAGVMADRSKGSLPTMFERKNPIAKLFTQFQLEGANQLNFVLKDLPREMKQKGVTMLLLAIMKFSIGAWIYNELYEKLIGRRPALDVIGMVNEAVGDYGGVRLPNMVDMVQDIAKGEKPNFQTERKGAYQATNNLLTNIVEEIPGIGGVIGGGRLPISSALPNPGKLLQAATEDDWSGKKRAITAVKELAKPAFYVAPPFGGGQLKKIIEGIEVMIRRGSYTVDKGGNDLLQYPVYRDTLAQTAGNAARTMIFGKTATVTGRKWIEEGFPKLSAEQTAVYRGMIEVGVTGKDSYELLEQIRKAEAQKDADGNTIKSQDAVRRDILRESKISGKGKLVAYADLFADEKELEVMKKLAETGIDPTAEAELLIELRNAQAVKGASGEVKKTEENVKREILRKFSGPDKAKRIIYEDLMAGEKQIEALKKIGQADGKTINAMLDLEMADKKSDKRKVLESSGLSDQKVLILEGMSTGWEEKTESGKLSEYGKLVGANKKGLSAAEGLRLQGEGVDLEKFIDLRKEGIETKMASAYLDAAEDLEPMEGKKQVADVQKWRVSVDLAPTDKAALQMLKQNMDESTWDKVDVGYGMGVSPAAYVTLKEVLPQYDADKNGSYKNDEVTEAIKAMTSYDISLPGGSKKKFALTAQQQAILWQIQTGSTTAKNNPFDKAAGESYVEQIGQRKEKRKEDKKK